MFSSLPCWVMTQSLGFLIYEMGSFSGPEVPSTQIALCRSAIIIIKRSNVSSRAAKRAHNTFWGGPFTWFEAVKTEPRISRLQVSLAHLPAARPRLRPTPASATDAFKFL